MARRFNWIAAGRRWRKTTLEMTLAIETITNGKTCLWGAPTFDQVRIGWNETRRAAGGIFEFTQQRMTASYPRTGGKIIFRSLDDPDNARGHTADRVLLDESGFINPIAYYEVVRPMLMDTGGDCWAGGTPNGRNWFWREHVAAYDRDDSVSWQIPTVGCEVVDGALVRKPHPYENPDIAWGEIVQLFDTLPRDIFKQEILAEFLEGQGVVFRNIGACMGAPIGDPALHQRHRIIVGVDWAKQSDFTAISVGCATCRQEVERDRFNQIDYAFQVERLRTMVERWRPTAILPERNSIGEPIIEQLVRMGLPIISGPDGNSGFMTTASTKPPLIENLALTFERAEWQFQQDPIWTAELEAYERTVSAQTGRSQYSAPEGMNDDTVIARALMVWAGRSAVSMPEQQPVQRSKWTDYDAEEEGSRWRKF
jgi:hypothetical protein